LEAVSTRLRIVGIRHAVYYTPQIVAAQNGYLRDEGIELEFVPGVPGSGLHAEVLAGRADVVLGGIWRPMLYVARGMPLVAFAQLNGHCDFQILAREGLGNNPDLQGARLLLTTTLAPSPWFAVREWLVRRGVDLGQLKIVPALPVGEARELFASGGADLIEIEDLDAVELLHGGGAVPVADWPQDLGSLPWGVYYTTREWFDEHPGESRGITNALARAQAWLAKHEPDEIAALISPSFEGTPTSQLEVLVELYGGRQRMWKDGPEISMAAYNRWSGILRRSGWLDSAPRYEDICLTAVDGRRD
jgi:NitT/TauT family transport system substrate-binding protein